MSYEPPRQPQLTEGERLLDCLLQQTIGNAQGALDKLDDLDFTRPFEREVLDAIRRQANMRTDKDGHVDPEAVFSDLLEKGHANDDVSRVITRIMHARTVPAMLATHLRAVHVSRFRRAAQAYAAGIEAKAKTGDLEELEVMVRRYEHLQPLIDRLHPSTVTNIHAA